MRGVTVTYTVVAGDTLFQLTRPMRGVTALIIRGVVRLYISTHTPHAGRDVVKRLIASCSAFQLTRPMRGVTPVAAAAVQ